jgi:multiple sugar transport system ATP-binding protein
MARVYWENATKRFGEVIAVNDLTLEVEDKEFLVLVGPSGCGKSTVIRLLAGLETLTSGNVYIGDRLVNDLPARDRDIAMVFQSYALYPHMSVFDNMAFGLKMHGVHKEEITRRVNEAADILDIEGLLKQKPAQLSGGQRQRVGVARALAADPPLLLMDEPFGALDPLTRQRLQSEFRDLQQRLARTVVLVTHDVPEALRLGDEVAVMDAGRVLQRATPREIREAPAPGFVRDFVTAALP